MSNTGRIVTHPVAGASGAGTGTLVVVGQVPLDATLRQVSDVDANLSPLWLSTTNIELSGPLNLTGELLCNGEPGDTDYYLASKGPGGGNPRWLQLPPAPTLTGYLRLTAPLDATSRVVEDYAGTDSPLWLSTAGVGLYGGAYLDLASTVAIRISSTTAIDGVKDCGLDRANNGVATYLDVTDGGAGLGRLRVGAGTLANPSLVIGTGTSGFWEPSLNYVKLGLAGVDRFGFFGGTGAGFYAFGGGALMNAVNNTTPSLVTANGNTTTGVGGHSGGTNLSLIVGSTEIVRCLKDASTAPVFRVASVLAGVERAADPSKPAEGEWALWQSNGVGLGDDGDVIIASTAGGTTNHAILFDHSAGTTWS